MVAGKHVSVNASTSLSTEAGGSGLTTRASDGLAVGAGNGLTAAKGKGLTVLGIDPGSQCLGWGVVREVSGVLSLVDCGAIRPKGDDFSARLGDLFLKLREVVERHAPDEAAVETVFTNKNILSALKLGQARGAAVAACAAASVPVFDYEPTLIKKTLVGAGRAEKTQVSFMVGRILNCKTDWAIDTGDALACAVCHLNMRRMRRLTGL